VAPRYKLQSILAGSAKKRKNRGYRPLRSRQPRYQLVLLIAAIGN
jgi:hypothetical protein